jgi:hypothetical protein
MARGRLISRTLGSSRKYAALRQAAGELGEFAQTLYPLLVSCSDDFGRQAGDAFTVKLVVFPSSPRTEDEFALALASLASVGLIHWYEAPGGQVVEIVEFDEHQPGLSKRTKSKFPSFPGNFTEIPSEENRTEQKGKEPKRTELRERFERFWESYPKKVGKDAAWVEFQKRNPGDDLTDRMIAVVTEQRASEQWRKDGGQYIPHPRTWLHQGRWQDEAPRSRPVEVEHGEDWFSECQRLHELKCGGRFNHHERMEIDKMRESA